MHRSSAMIRSLVPSVLVPSVLVAALALGCSSDDAASDVTAATTTEPPAATEPPATSASSTDDANGADDDSTDVTVDESPDQPLATAPPEPTLPEVGVPGLDSEFVVCRAWSRFAGSFQIAAVAASFGDDPLEAARLEVMASPMVVAAVTEMIDNWPDELADEVDLVADGYVGPYGRRAAVALAALEDAAGDRAGDEAVVDALVDAVVDAVADLWLEALEQRDPSEVLPELIVPDDLAAVIDAAAEAFDSQVVPIPLDPSLVSNVSVPRSEEFLFETCPDRGTLAGSDAVG